MKPAETLSTVGKNLLWMNDIDIGKTDWIEQYENDFIIVHNPTFRFSRRHPYRLEHVMVVICEEGNASGSVNLKPIDLQRNKMLIVLARHIMESHAVSDDFKGTYIFMSQEFLSMLNVGDSYKFYETIDREPCFRLDERMADAIHSYITMSRAMIRIADLNPNTGESLRLLTRLFLLTLGWFIHSDAIGKESTARQSNIMDRFIPLVKSHYKEHRDVEYYARCMNLTAKYMSTQIKCASGKSALQWIEEYVILDAKTQLASTLNSVQQIGYDLNFPTQSFFGRYFKRATGLSPSAYRDSIQLHQAKTPA